MIASGPNESDTEPAELPADKPRALRLIPELPDGRTRRAFQTALTKLGLSNESAAAVARAVVDPEVARATLSSPTRYRIPGAELLVIRVDVYTSRIIADATNPRTLNDMLFPAAAAVGDPRMLFPPLEPPTSDTHDFTITVSSVEQIVWQLDRVMEATIRVNTPRPPIGEQGVMEPPLAVPARIVDSSGTSLGGTVLVREGSSRVSHAQQILGLDARQVLVDLVDDASQREMIADLNGIAQSSVRAISANDAAKVRVGTVPIDLVVGVEPDADVSINLGEAVAAKVAQDHLNHKQEWKASAKEVHLGEQCLIALHEDSLLTDDEKQWLAGRLGANELVDGKRRFEDDRWAELLWLFTTRARPQYSVIRRPIATVLERDVGRQNVTRADRIPLAVALAMRARRGVATDASVDRESRLLENGVPALVWQSPWKPSGRSIEELEEAAIEDATNRAPGEASAELAARALWYMAKNGHLSMPRNDLGPGGDRRPPSDLISGMLASIRGIRQLGQAIRDGRSGRRAGRVLDDAGNLDISGIGEPVVLQDENVRTDLVPRSGPPAPPPRDPRAEFLDAVARFGRALRDAQSANAELQQIEDGHGQPMVTVEGVDISQVEDFQRILRGLQADLSDYGVSWRVSQQTRTVSDPSDP